MRESETLEFKKSLGELQEGIIPLWNAEKIFKHLSEKVGIIP